MPAPAIPAKKQPRRSLGLAVGLSNLAAGRSVVVETEFVAGRYAVAEELLSSPPSSVVKQVAEGVRWLAAHGLLHVDVRLPNVLVEEGDGGGGGGGGAPPRAVLVDYDDCALLEAPITSFAELDAAFKARRVQWWDVFTSLRDELRCTMP